MIMSSVSFASDPNASINSAPTAIMPPKIAVDPNGFQADENDIIAICSSAGQELWKYFPDVQIPSIIVRHSDICPMAVFHPSENQEQIILLATSGNFWCQYSYQFSHEIAHVLAGFKDGNIDNHWFEETICETASLFVLRQMANSWKSSPPKPHWADYRDILRNYADITMRNYPYTNELFRLGMPAFYQKYAQKLRTNPCNRDLNGSMAIVLLHYFEESPQHWEAIHWLNAKRTEESVSFNIYLKNWYQSVPNEHKGFVLKIAKLYGIVH
ncbi:MAG: hypothetical protein Q4C95_06170 [Planctomycetia bacterium]|nr:hypothetical protein [Planctomycetia bacterium]